MQISSSSLPICHKCGLPSSPRTLKATAVVHNTMHKVCVCVCVRARVPTHLETSPLPTPTTFSSSSDTSTPTTPLSLIILRKNEKWHRGGYGKDAGRKRKKRLFLFAPAEACRIGEEGGRHVRSQQPPFPCPENGARRLFILSLSLFRRREHQRPRSTFFLLGVVLP